MNETKTGKKPFSKSRLIKELSWSCGLPQTTVKALLETLSGVARREAPNTFVLPGICKLEVVRRKPRKVRNPRTGETHMLPEREALRITAPRSLKVACARVIETPPAPAAPVAAAPATVAKAATPAPAPAAPVAAPAPALTPAVPVAAAPVATPAPAPTPTPAAPIAATPVEQPPAPEVPVATAPAEQVPAPEEAVATEAVATEAAATAAPEETAMAETAEATAAPEEAAVAAPEEAVAETQVEQAVVPEEAVAPEEAAAVEPAPEEAAVAAPEEVVAETPVEQAPAPEEAVAAEEAAPAAEPEPEPAPAVDPNMLISFRCTRCKQEVEATGDMVGLETECPTCGNPIVVPAQSEPGTIHGAPIEGEDDGLVRHAQTVSSQEAESLSPEKLKGLTIRIDVGELDLDDSQKDEDASEQMVSFVCMACKQEIEASRDMAGETTACPNCGEPLIVPSESTANTLHSTSQSTDAKTIQAMKGRTMRIDLGEDF